MTESGNRNRNNLQEQQETKNTQNLILSTRVFPRLIFTDFLEVAPVC